MRTRWPSSDLVATRRLQPHEGVLCLWDAPSLLGRGNQTPPSKEVKLGIEHGTGKPLHRQSAGTETQDHQPCMWLAGFTYSGIPSHMRKSSHRLRNFLGTHQKKGEEARAAPPLWGCIGSEQVMGEGETLSCLEAAGEQRTLLT